jgi:hypothetical protein
MANLRARVLRLERRERIRRRWVAAQEYIARREKQGRMRVAAWRRRQEEEPEPAT